MTEFAIRISLSDFDALPLSPEQFTPGIYDVIGLGVTYFDGRMSGSVDIGNQAGQSVLSISTWDSEYPGNGFSRAALEWLRQSFERIEIIGAGEVDGDGVGDIATGYWLHMRNKGLVDAIFLDNGSELVPEGETATSPSPIPQ